jgi:amino acid transporter
MPPGRERISSEEVAVGEARAVVRRLSWLIGRPLPTADAERERIGRGVGLAVFSSDALSSTAYATQEILLVLAVAGLAEFYLAWPIALAIVGLLAIVVVSYYRTIHAYPDGGGAYVVARENLGEIPAQVAGAALLTDYILTVAVSVSSGVAQLASAFPVLFDHRVALGIALVGVVTVVNLRGVRESGTVFAIPTYFFLTMAAATVGLGFWRLASGDLGPVEGPPPLDHASSVGPVTLFLILHALSNGTTALTGTEAISNGVTAFREPRARNAAHTLLWMGAILAGLFLSITFLAIRVGAVPAESETVVSQIARSVYGGRGAAYLTMMAGTMLILVMAANTAFNGFPRLGALQAADGYLPKQLTYRGSRLVYSRGIVVLALLAALLIWLFEASVSRLIPLYAIGVFVSFTLCQAGMTRRWWSIGRRRREGSVPGDARLWLPKMLINGFGALCTAIVVVVFAITKMEEGAYIVLVLIPALVALFLAIRRHYVTLQGRLSLADYGAPPRIRRHRVIVPVSGVHRGTLAALRYARSLTDDVTAVHVSNDAVAADEMRRQWDRWGDGVRLVVLASPYRLLLEPLLDYVQRISAERQRDETLTIVVPQFVPRRSWHNLLHAQTAGFLRLALMFRPGIVITNVPYQVGAAMPEERRS